METIAAQRPAPRAINAFIRAFFTSFFLIFRIPQTIDSHMPQMISTIEDNKPMIFQLPPEDAMIKAAAQMPRHMRDILHGMMYAFLQIRLINAISANTTAAVNTKNIKRKSHIISQSSVISADLYAFLRSKGLKTP